MIRRVVLAGVLVCVVALWSSQRGPGAAAQGGTVPRVDLDGQPHAFLPQLCARYGVELDWNPAAGICVLRQDDRVIEGRLTSARWLMNGRFVFGSGPLREYQDVPVVRVEDVTVVLSGVLGRPVNETEVAALFGPAAPTTPLPAAAPASQRPVLQSVRSIPYPRYTRLVLTFNAPVEYEVIAEREGRLRIDFPGVDPGPNPGPLQIADGVVETVGWRLGPSGALLVTVLTADPATEYDAYYLEDPVRLILDFQRAVTTAPQVVVPGAGATPVMPQAPEADIPLAPPKPFTTVVIDPGHGGRDPGAQGPGGVFEKQITLGIAEKLQARLESELGLTVLLTRTGDYHVPIAQRTQFANTAVNGGPADLFISIHTNSIANVRASGFEAYFVSEAVDPGAGATAALENAAMDWDAATEGGVNDLLRQVLWDLQFAAFTEESHAFAVLAQEHLGRRLTIENRGVKQAPFLVLSGCAMPSVLVEVGFISNRTEEVILQTPEFQKQVAAALTNAVAEFKARRERRLGLASAGAE